MEPFTVQVPKKRGCEGRYFRPELLTQLKTARENAVAVPKGVSTIKFDGAPKVLVGESVCGLSPSTIMRVKLPRQVEYAECRLRDGLGHEFVCMWEDGINVHVRAEK